MASRPGCHFLYFHVGEILLRKIHLFHPEGLAVQVGQRPGVRGEGEGQLVGIQRLIVPVEALVQLAVLAVSQQRVSRVGELSADLVRPTGDQLALHQRKPRRACEGFVIGLAGLAAGLGRVRDGFSGRP